MVSLIPFLTYCYPIKLLYINYPSALVINLFKQSLKQLDINIAYLRSIHRNRL